MIGGTKSEPARVHTSQNFRKIPLRQPDQWIVLPVRYDRNSPAKLPLRLLQLDSRQTPLPVALEFEHALDRLSAVDCEAMTRAAVCVTNIDERPQLLRTGDLLFHADREPCE